MCVGMSVEGESVQVVLGINGSCCQLSREGLKPGEGQWLAL